MDQQLLHRNILSSFDEDLEKLKSISLAPSLQRIRRDRSLSSDLTPRSSEKASIGEFQASPGPQFDNFNIDLNESSKFRESFVKQPSAQSIERNTLYDCIPIEKERRWALQCRDVHATIEGNIRELNELYGNITSLVNTLDEPTIDFKRMDDIQTELANCCQHQLRNMDEIRSNYQYVYGTLTQQSSDKKSEQHVTILSQLETIRIQQEATLSSMLNLCEISLRLKNQVGKSKETMTKCLFSRITLIAIVQTDTQRLLQRLMQMKRWYKGRNEYFSHLEHVAHLPLAYQAFLKEIIRRRHYHAELESKILTFTESLSHMRAEETSYRKEFMQRHGRNLPPIFFEFVPSLVEKPPYYNAEASNIPILPPISDDDLLTLREQLQLSLRLSGTDDDLQVVSNDNVRQKIQTTSETAEPAHLQTQQELIIENRLLKDKIAELTRELELRPQGDAKHLQIKQAIDQDLPPGNNVSVDEQYKSLMVLLSEGLMDIKSSLVAEILQKLPDTAGSLNRYE